MIGRFTTSPADYLVAERTFLAWVELRYAMNAESLSFMRFFEPLVRTSSLRWVDPSDRRTDAW